MIYITGGTATITKNSLNTSKADGVRACNNAVLNAKKNTITKTKFGFGLKDLGKGNVLHSNTITSTRECGIYIMNVKKCNILKNTVKNVKGHALFGAGTAKWKTSLNITGNTLKTSSSSKRDIYLGKYSVNCRIRKNTWTKRGYTHDPSVKASVSGNKCTQ